MVAREEEQLVMGEEVGQRREGPPVPAIDPSLLRFSSQQAPESKSIMRKLPLPWGALCSPFAASPPLVAGPPSRCSSCQAFLHAHCHADLMQRQWTCSFCGEKQALPPGAASERSHFPALCHPAVDYLDPAPQPHIVSDSSPIQMILIDGHLTHDEMKSLVTSLSFLLSQWPEECRVGLIVYTEYVSLYEMTSSHMASCEVYSGDRTLSTEEITSLTQRRNRFLVSLGHWRSYFPTLLQHLLSSAPERAAPRGQQRRAFGTAMHLALQLASESHGEVRDGRYEGTRGGQVLAFLGGCPSWGPGALSSSITGDEAMDYETEQATQFYRQLASQATPHHLSVDLYCLGLECFRVRVLQNLVLSTGGLVITFKEYDSTLLQENLLLGYQRQQGCRQATMDIVTSPGMAITHIIGPAIRGGDDTTKDRCVLSTTQPDVALSLYYTVEDVLVQDRVSFQFVVRFINAQQQRVLRVLTHTLPVASNERSLIRSLDEHVVLILMAKKMILQARKVSLAQQTQVIQQLDQKVRKIYRACEQWGELSMTLPQLPYRLFLLRRGPLLGPILQHSDDIDYARCLFIQASFLVCLRMIDPPFHRVLLGDFQEMPLEDLALQSHNVLLLDHHTDILIWEGRQVGEEASQLVEIAKELALERAASRFPRPQILHFTQRSSMARWLLSRLIPSHKDPRASVETRFPFIHAMSDQEYATFIRQFHDTDDLSFYQYSNLLSP